MPKIIRMRVFDRPGVLDRITGLIRRNGVNIKTLTSGDTGDGISQITISLGDQVKLDALGERFGEMGSVRDWEKCLPTTHLIRELMLARFSAEQKDLIPEGMRILREENDLIFAEYADEPPAVDAMLETLRGRNVACARAGALSLPLAEGKMR